MTDLLIRDAAISPDGRYRYALERRWQHQLDPRHVPGASPLEAVCLFVMLNPSTADHRLDDPTVRRCVGYARSWGYTALAVCNLFALRTSDPAELYRAPDPVGPDNDDWIRLYASRDPLIVCAWGTHGDYRERAGEVLDVLDGKSLFCLGTTRSGQPAHPLYLSAGLVPERYAP